MARLDPLALSATLPFWGGRVSPVPLAGGLTNVNFVVEDGGRRYVVRVGGDIPAHNIVRTVEAAASRAARGAGATSQAGDEGLCLQMSERGFRTEPLALGLRPRRRVILVVVPVSSRKTSRCGSSRMIGWRVDAD
jgi:hypothetical protein